ncbi:plasmid replication protein, CyRepA1 family [Acaryochloris sp. CCMEE 5410]|uniref:plasmid replication protein, CyRepA1 family n=1 Tax=Acaryochloris sp. CCMEE 5410 TaxID=310037 RepID=UPI000248522D|nr:plasmid replication protein, CyRepA1 family [Acaryochloris sp. CCMEE 5410]KAI9130169.1 hypothetical protein ON05_031580 [Acaryochloris sp. CCMEE 5410]
MSSFHYYKNKLGDLCPICNGSRGKPDCRKSSSGTYFCRGPENHSGEYRFDGFDTHGFGKYITAEAHSQRSNPTQEQEQERLARERQLAAERAQRLSQLPSIEERDYQFHRIAASAGLGSQQRQHLIEHRGLSNNQIHQAVEKHLFWTWQDNAKLPLLPLNLPGVDPSTGLLRRYYQGLAIAVPNVHGQITGVQIRPNFGGGYFWVSSSSDKLPIPGSGPQLPTGESPIAVHRTDSKTIGLVDSVALKPYLASQQMGITFIGATGFNFASSPEAVKETLEVLQPEQIILYPDAGDSSNRSVYIAIAKTASLLQGWGYSLSIAWWDQHSYDDDSDIDELDLDKQQQIRLLTPSTYLAMSKAIIDDQWQHQYEQQSLKIWKKSRQFTPTQTIHEQFLNLQPADLDGADIVAIKSGMGTGKTEWLKNYFSQISDGAVAIGYRNSLLLQSCERWPGFYHLHSDSAQPLIPDPQSRIACCLDSLTRFEDKDFDGKIVILDESLSVVLHGLMSGTLTGKRDKCLAKLKAAIQRAKLVLPMDGNNTDVVVDYLAQLREVGTCRKILNTYQRQQLHIELLGNTITAEGNTIDERSPVLQLAFDTLAALDLAPSNTPRSIVLFSDSQRQCQIAESLFQQRGYSTLRVDSKTSPNKEVKQFLKDPDFYLEETQPRVLIYSPTAESGLNVGIQNFFYKGFGLFFGVLPISSMTQMMQRVRALKEIAVWCKRYTHTEDEGTRSVLPRRLQQWMTDYLRADAFAALQGSDRESTVKEWINKLLKTYNDPHLSTHNILAASINYERKHTWDCLRLALQEAGHRVTIVDLPQVTSLKEEASEIRDQILTTDAQAIFNAKDITLSQAIHIKSRWSATLAERWSCDKAFLLHRLPGLHRTDYWTPDVVKALLFTNRSLIPSLERWWLINHQTAAQNRSRQRWEKLMEDGAIPFLPDIRSDFALIEALCKINLLALFESNQSFNSSSSLIQQIYRTCKRREIVTALKRTVGKQKPMEFLGRLAKLIGGKTEVEQNWQRNSERGKRRYYFISPDNIELNHVLLECIETRFQQYMEAPECTENKGIEVATPATQKCIIISRGVAKTKIENTQKPSLITLPVSNLNLPDISPGALVKRCGDQVVFRVRKIVNEFAWLSWVGQPVDLVDIPCPLQNLEPIQSSVNISSA